MKTEFKTFYTQMALELLNGNLTFFMGTGFSMQLTNGQAPSYERLLFEVLESVENRLEEASNNHDEKWIDEKKTQKNECVQLKKQLFSEHHRAKYDLQITAQIIEDFCNRCEQDSKVVVADCIGNDTEDGKIDKQQVNKLKESLMSFSDGKQIANVNFITTNYDDLIGGSCLEGNCNRIFGNKIESSMKKNMPDVYHIHGVASNPKSMVLTMKDYFKFERSNDYISHKFYSLLYETTVVIMGYSLQDFDLNLFLSEVNDFKKQSMREKNIFYISRNSVDHLFKEYYFLNYGIRVIDNTGIDEFFLNLANTREDADEVMSLDFGELLKGDNEVEDELLHNQMGLGQICAGLSSVSSSLNDPKTLHFIFGLVERKLVFTKEPKRFEQYVHLASWLIFLLKNLDFERLTITDEKRFEKFLQYSFENMSKELNPGYSWNAYAEWKRRIKELNPKQREYLLRFIEDRKFKPENNVDGIKNELNLAQ
ncbi:SIR2 family NAD-dependent protein deacylase [Furfurilactobacillus sp. WILCCON 0119]